MPAVMHMQLVSVQYLGGPAGPYNAHPLFDLLLGHDTLKNHSKAQLTQMPIADPEKRQIAQRARLYLKICFKCGAHNSLAATRCRKCHNNYLRLKNRVLGVKK